MTVTHECADIDGKLELWSVFLLSQTLLGANSAHRFIHVVWSPSPTKQNPCYTPKL